MPHPVLGVPSDSHGNTATITQDPPQALPELCAQVHQRLEAFLRAEPATERLRQVQEQSRLSLKVLEEALERYGYVGPGKDGIGFMDWSLMMWNKVWMNYPSPTTAAKTASSS